MTSLSAEDFSCRSGGSAEAILETADLSLLPCDTRSRASRASSSLSTSFESGISCILTRNLFTDKPFRPWLRMTSSLDQYLTTPEPETPKPRALTKPQLAFKPETPKEITQPY